MTSSLPSYDFDLKLAEFKINGFCIFEDLMPVEKIDRIREAFTPHRPWHTQPGISK